MATPHINAERGAVAETVLMPGDPLRAEFIAKTYLENVVCYTKVRNMFGFTGEYKGKKVSVQGSGMGMPSMGIYSHELFEYFGIERIIRVGTAGAVSENVNLLDVVIGQAACTNSNYCATYSLPGTFAPIADFSLLAAAADYAEREKTPYHIGNILSSDVFYDDSQTLAQWQKMNVLAVEMEAAALYANAARLGKKALTVLTVSDCPLRGLATTSEEREKSFTQMMELALNII